MLQNWWKSGIFVIAVFIGLQLLYWGCMHCAGSVLFSRTSVSHLFIVTYLHSVYTPPTNYILLLLSLKADTEYGFGIVDCILQFF